MFYVFSDSHDGSLLIMSTRLYIKQRKMSNTVDIKK
nr:MAG TPA_asm: hypothetical protein [Caudoviricetes sp.]DAL57234.1 MAG TPA_asm: hypothetical protein [Caudoviricetes sp.]DAL91901.1 MAG TPA: hypothetical protein [Caudoviricetes sp.]DAM94866.1 MAG TPA: hypothetical protein [Caudoviricetes sp.]